MSAIDRPEDAQYHAFSTPGTHCRGIVADTLSCAADPRF